MSEVHSGRINWLSWHGVSWQAMRERDRANDKRTTTWAFCWVATLMLSRLPAAFEELPQWVGWTLGAISLVVGAQFVRSYLRMVREADELLRQIQLEGLAVGFGAGVICGFTAITFTQPSIWLALVILMAMSFGYVISVLLAARAVARAGE